MAITLPSQYKYIVIADEITNEINNHEFVDAMDIVGSVYDKEEAYHYKKDENTGVVLFKTLTVIELIIFLRPWVFSPSTPNVSNSNS